MVSKYSQRRFLENPLVVTVYMHSSVGKKGEQKLSSGSVFGELPGRRFCSTLGRTRGDTCNTRDTRNTRVSDGQLCLPFAHASRFAENHAAKLPSAQAKENKLASHVALE